MAFGYSFFVFMAGKTCHLTNVKVIQQKTGVKR